MTMPRILLLLLTFLLVATSPGLADQRLVALGSAGAIYQVETGTHQELFPGSHSTNPVLALAIYHPDAPTQRVLVPGTEGAEAESSANLLYEEASNTVYLIWESRNNYIHSQIKLASFTDQAWTNAIELPGEFFSLKASPSLAVTRDTFVSINAEGNPVSHARAVYHVIWWEEAAAGERVVYSPVVLIDGEYVGHNPLLILNDLGFAPGARLWYSATDDLARSPSIQAGADHNSVVVGLIDPASEQLVQLELSMIPGELGAIADQVARVILDAGDSESPLNLADRARGHLIDFGARLRMHPAMISIMALEALDSVSLASSESLTTEELADRARGHLIDFGARLAAQGMTGVDDERPGWRWEVEGAPTPNSGLDAPLHTLRLRQMAARPIPRTNPHSPTTIYLSDSGEEALVAWLVGSYTLFYQESVGEDWGPVHRLKLDGEQLDLERAHTLLALRARSR